MQNVSINVPPIYLRKNILPKTPKIYIFTPIFVREIYIEPIFPFPFIFLYLKPSQPHNVKTMGISLPQRTKTPIALGEFYCIKMHFSIILFMKLMK